MSEDKKEILSALGNNYNDINKINKKQMKKKKKEEKFNQKVLEEFKKKKEREVHKKNKNNKKDNDKSKSKNDSEDIIFYPEKDINNKPILIIMILIFLGILGYNIYNAFNKEEYILEIVSSSLLYSGIILSIVALMISNAKKRFITHIFAIILVLSFVVINLLSFYEIISLPKQAALPDFINKNVSEAIIWANENNVEINPIYEFSDSVDENNIIMQSIEDGILVRNIKEVEIIVSNGPNYDLNTTLPSMLGWNVDEVIKTIKDLNYNLDKLNINFNFNEADKDTLYEQSKTGTTSRNEELILDFSLGLEENLEPVELIDLKNKETFDATLWLKRNGIKYELSYEFSETVSLGNVISTDPKSGTVINQKEDTVTLVISKGKEIITPNFSKMTLDEIIEWANDNNININYTTEYSDIVDIGEILKVDTGANVIIEEGSTITIVTSKGALTVIDFNNDINILRSFANEHNITIVELLEFNDEVNKDEIISTSHKAGDKILPGASIEVTISKGSKISVPSFIGLSESAANSKCNELGITCSISRVYSSSTVGTVVNQNKSVGSEISSGSSIVLSVSAGVKPSTSTSTPSTSTPSTNPSTPSTPEPDPEPTCNTTTLYIQPHLISADPATTCSLVKSAYPGYKFSCSYVNSDSGSKGLILNASSLNGTTINSCNTVTLSIRNN